MDALARLREHGLSLTADGETLLVEPRSALTDELRALIRAHKAAILAALASVAAPVTEPPPGGRLVICAGCRSFEPGAGELGQCKRFGEPAWAAAPFACPGFLPADEVAHALERRRMRMGRELAAHRQQRIAADVTDAPLRAAAGEPVSVMIAVRQETGILSAELSIPRERFEPARFLETLSAEAA